MALLLSIRNNLVSSEYELESDWVTTCRQGPVTVGKDRQCTCPLEDAELADTAVTLDSDPQGRTWTLAAVDDPSAVYRNHRPVDPPETIRSGDELRVGHWTVRCYKLHAAAKRLRRTEVMAGGIKTLVIAACLAQIAFIAWLPHQVRESAWWDKDEMRQKSLVLLDSLRTENGPAKADTALDRQARKLIQNELQRRTAYVQRHRDSISLSGWRSMYADLLQLRALLQRVHQDKAWQPIPSYDQAAGLREVLRQAESPAQQ